MHWWKLVAGADGDAVNVIGLAAAQIVNSEAEMAEYASTAHFEAAAAMRHSARHVSLCVARVHDETREYGLLLK